MRIIAPSYITDDTLISCDIPQADPNYPEWDAATSYVLGERISVTDPGVHRVYQSAWATPENINKYPPDNLDGDPPFWSEICATNRWKLFDLIVAPDRAIVEDNVVAVAWETAADWELGTKWNDVTSSSMQVTVAPGQIDTIAVMNADCEVIAINMEDPVEGIVHEDYNVPSTTEYYNNVFLSLPSYPNATVQVIIKSSGQIAIGEIIFGKLRTLGRTRYGVGIGLVDFSVKQTDEFGTFEILERAFSKRIDANFDMAIEDHSSVMRILENYRSTPLVWIVSNLYSTLLIYGYYRDFAMSITGPSLAECALSIEGLGADMIYAVPPDDEWIDPWKGYIELTSFAIAVFDDAAMALDVIAEAPVLMEGFDDLDIEFDMPTISLPRALQTLYLYKGQCLISNAEPTVITFNSHNLPNDHRVLFKCQTGDPLYALPAPLVVDRVYYAENVAANTFNITLTMAGSTVDTTDDGYGLFYLYANNDYYIKGANASHAMSSDNVDLEIGLGGVANASHAMSSDNVILQPILLKINNAAHAVSSDNVVVEEV